MKDGKEMEDRWLSVDGIVEYIGVSRDTIYSWLREGKMPCHRAGHLWKFKRAEVDQWLRAGEAANGPGQQDDREGDDLSGKDTEQAPEEVNVNLT